MAKKQMTFRLNQQFVVDTFDMLRRTGFDVSQAEAVEIGLAALRNYAAVMLQSKDDEYLRDEANRRLNFCKYLRLAYLSEVYNDKEQNQADKEQS